MSVLKEALTSEGWKRNRVVENMKDIAMAPHHSSSLGEALAYGVVAGLLGNVALNLSNLVEQRLTGRPDSHVPAHTFQRLFGLKEKSDRHSKPANAAFEWGIGALSGAMRGVMSQQGMRGPYATFVHMAARACTDQSLENSVKTSSPPWTWPYDEQLLDLVHKGIYALVTGLIADRLVYSSRKVASNRR